MDKPTISKVRVWALEHMADIDRDARYHYPPAKVQVNAPLALEQVNMTAKMGILRELMGFLETLDKVQP